MKVRDVVKDADGTVHTRYERIYAGLPVLGGDLIVHASKSGAIDSVTRSYKPRLKVADLSAEVSRATVERKAVQAARAEGSTKTEADSTRKVVWAAKGAPKLAYETVVSGFQHDDTPSELHVITDAQSGDTLFEYEGVHTGTGNTRYTGTVPLGTSQSGSAYTLTDADRGNHRTYNLNRGSSGMGTLFSGADDVWGDGTTTDPETAGADAHYGAALTWDYYKNVHGRNGLRNLGTADEALAPGGRQLRGQGPAVGPGGGHGARRVVGGAAGARRGARHSNREDGRRRDERGRGHGSSAGGCEVR